jgi:hypothetical protein
VLTVTEEMIDAACQSYWGTNDIDGLSDDARDAMADAIKAALMGRKPATTESESGGCA